MRAAEPTAACCFSPRLLDLLLTALTKAKALAERFSPTIVNAVLQSAGGTVPSTALASSVHCGQVDPQQLSIFGESKPALAAMAQSGPKIITAADFVAHCWCAISKYAQHQV